MLALSMVEMLALRHSTALAPVAHLSWRTVPGSVHRTRFLKCVSISWQTMQVSPRRGSIVEVFLWSVIEMLAKR